jgi:hypothetical protein
MIPHYIAYTSFNGFAGIIYLLAMPDMLWGSKTRKFSEAIMHMGVVLAAVYLSNQLWLAETTDNIFSPDQCGRLF